MSDVVEHSPLGGSSAKRWMTCAGSYNHSKGIEQEESEYASAGTAAHTLAAQALTEGRDTWEYIGLGIKGGKWYSPSELKNHPEAHVVDADMANAVAVYTSYIRKSFPGLVGTQHSGVEENFRCPSIHKLFYSTADFWCRVGSVLDVIDYKHGAGIIVEVPWNEQALYYACGVMEKYKLWSRVDAVRIAIVQPNGWHSDGPIRTWEIGTERLATWLYEKLIPAMTRAEVSRDTVVGEHCRFCPAMDHACPGIEAAMKRFKEMVERINADGGVGELTDDEVAEYMKLADVAKMVTSRVQKIAYNRLQAGSKIDGRKLAQGKVNREWKSGAKAALIKKFGDDAYTAPVLKSPAQIEAMPRGTSFVKRWAAKPPGKLTVVSSGDTRREVSRDTKSMFQAATKKRKAARG